MMFHLVRGNSVVCIKKSNFFLEKKEDGCDTQYLISVREDRELNVFFRCEKKRQFHRGSRALNFTRE